MKSFNKAVLAGAGILLVSGSALAATPYPNIITGGNLWRITFYNDTTTTNSLLTTQNICFSTTAAAKGTGITGAWRSTTFSGWDGRYYQEGDEFRFYGDFGSNTGHSHGICEFIGNTLAACTYDEWTENSTYGTPTNWTNAKMERIGTCTFTAAAAVAAADSMTLAGENPSPSRPK